MHQNHLKVILFLNPLKSDNFMFSTKTLCQIFFQTCLKGFKLKRMVVEPKTTQLVEPDEEPIDLFSLTGRKVQKPSFSFRTLVQQVEVRSRGNRGPMVICQTLNANG